MSGQQFVAGEFVARVLDGKVGQVVKAEPYNDTWIYYVDFSRFDHREEGGLWGGLNGAWRPYFTLHAHVETESRDCDGRYTGGHVEQMTLQERCDPYGDLLFRQRVLGGVVSLHGRGTLDVSPEGMTWNETTEEGYRAADVRWCEDDCPEASWQRDHTAERMGY
jgi:hypothetical protein